MVYGVDRALLELKEYDKNPSAIKNMLFYAIKGDLLKKADQFPGAANALEKAIELSENELEKKHLQKKLSALYQD